MNLTRKAARDTHSRAAFYPGTGILIAYRHGLRASELAAPRWDDIPPEYCPDFSATFTTIAFDNSSLRWLEIST